MPATYSKRLLRGTTPDGRTVGLYVNVVDSQRVGYWVTLEGRTVATWKAKSKDGAVAKFHSVCAGEIPALRTLDDEADKVERHPTTPVPEVRFPLLAELERRACERRQVSDAYANRTAAVATLVGNDPLPVGEAAFLEWLDGALTRLCSGAKTQSTVRVRLVVFARCMKQMAIYPGAFRQHRFLGLLAPRMDMRRGEVAAPPVESRMPFTAKELRAILDGCQSYAQVALALCYAAMGCRAGEAERMTYGHLAGECYRLRLIQTKTKTQKEPAAPLVVRALLRWMRDSKTEFAVLPDAVDRKRFRATAGVMLTLAGMDALSVSTRLGHASTHMMQEHYVKVMPEDYAGIRSFSQYVGVGPVLVNGTDTAQNAWDGWLLYLALTHAAKHGIPLKSAVLEEMGQGVAEAPAVADF